MSEPEKNGPKNGLSILAGLLHGSDPTSKLILAAVVFLGGGNFWQGFNASQEQRREVDRALEEIHEVRAALDPLSARQKEIFDAVKEIQSRQQSK